MGEYTYRSAKEAIAKNSDGSLSGDVVQVGSGLNLKSRYLLSNNWEISGRYTAIRLDEEITGINSQTQCTLGLSKYIVVHKLKVQSDLSYLFENYSSNGLMYRLQVEFISSKKITLS